MKKLLITLFILMLGLSAFASDKDDAAKFFTKFESASNNYSSEVLYMYANNAKIIRQVVKPNGTTANAYFTAKDYKSQMKLNSAVAKLRKYKNYYSNISVEKVSDGYKISAMRKPSLSNYKLKCYLIVQKQQNDKWIIVEEMMQTKEQIFLRYVK